VKFELEFSLEFPKTENTRSLGSRRCTARLKKCGLEGSEKCDGSEYVGATPEPYLPANRRRVSASGRRVAFLSFCQSSVT
jgi:hypothetical protein